MKYKKTREDYEFEEEITKKNIVKINKNNQEYTEDEYNEISNKLMNTNVDYKNIFGYKAKNKNNEIVYCKWNKNTEDFVVYNDYKVIKLYKKSYREYESEKYIDDKYEYVDEIF